MNACDSEIIYGIHPVFEALQAGRRQFHEIYLAREAPSSRFGTIADIAASRNIPLNKIDMPRLGRMSETDHHQGIGARVSPYPLTKIADIIDRDRSGTGPPFLIILDNVVDPHNLGAIIRSALAVDVDGIIIPKDRAVGPTPAVSKTSAGMLEHARLSRVTNIVATIKILKEKGLWLFGLDSVADQSLYDSDLSGAAALIIGGEEKGIRPLVRKNCDVLLSIPQSERVESLNVSVAAAVAMYEVFRQRLAVDTS